jgi:hypothetical protein
MKCPMLSRNFDFSNFLQFLIVYVVSRTFAAFLFSNSGHISKFIILQYFRTSVFTLTKSLQSPVFPRTL